MPIPGLPIALNCGKLIYDVANRTKCIQAIPKDKVQLALRAFHLCLVIADAITHTVEVLDVTHTVEALNVTHNVEVSNITHTVEVSNVLERVRQTAAPLLIWYTWVALCWFLLVFEAVILAWFFHKYQRQSSDPEYYNSKWAFASKLQQFAVLLVNDWLITLPYIILGSACYIDGDMLRAQANKVSVTVSLLGSVFRACYVFICGWIYHMGRSHARRSFSGLCSYFMVVLLTSISPVVIIYKVMLVFYHFPIYYAYNMACWMDLSIATTVNSTTAMDKTHEEESLNKLLNLWFFVLLVIALPAALLQCFIWWLGACLWSCLYYRRNLPLYVNSVHVLTQYQLFKHTRLFKHYISHIKRVWHASFQIL